jgi:hypothetical protein
MYTTFLLLVWKKSENGIKLRDTNVTVILQTLKFGKTVGSPVKDLLPEMPLWNI